MDFPGEISCYWQRATGHAGLGVYFMLQISRIFFCSAWPQRPEKLLGTQGGKEPGSRRLAQQPPLVSEIQHSV